MVLSPPELSQPIATHDPPDEQVELEGIPSAVEEQRGLLSLEISDPDTSNMGSDAVKLEGRKGDALAGIVIWGSLAVFVGVTWAIVFSNDPTSLGWFKYHPLLQTLAIASFTYGILTLQPTVQPKTKAAGLERHKIATALFGVPLVVAGTVIMIYVKESKGKPHFATWHGTFGIISTLWLVAQLLVGGSTVWFDGALWGGGMKAKAMWKYHRLSGYILFPTVLFTAYLGGAWSGWVNAHSEPFVRLLAYTVAPFCVLAGVYSRVRTSKMKFF